MVKQILLICIAAVLLGLGARVVQDKPVPFWGTWAPMETIQPKVAIAEVSKVSADSAFAPADFPYSIDFGTAMSLYSKRKRANVHFVDSRDTEQYAAGHIADAINIPYEEFGKYFDVLSRIPKDNLLVIYCDGGDCHLSHDLAEFAIPEGWRRICVYEGGWEEWSAESDFVSQSDVGSE